jgi:hypothetical protein
MLTSQKINFVQVEWAKYILCDSKNFRLCGNMHISLFTIYVEQK